MARCRLMPIRAARIPGSGAWPGFLGSGRGAPHHRVGRFRGPLSTPAPGHQSCLAQPDIAGGSGKHLCRREPFPRRHPAPESGRAANKGRNGTAASGACRGAAAGHPGRWIVGFRLCWSGRRAGLLPTGTLRLPAHGRTVPGVRNSHPPDHRRRPEYPLLSGLSEVGIMVFGSKNEFSLPESRSCGPFWRGKSLITMK